MSLLGFALGSQEPAQDPLVVHFESKVRPLLIGRCEECHGETADGGLRLDTREGLMKGGDSGPAIVIGDPDASLLIQVVRHTHAKLKMPKRRPQLSPDEVRALSEWVQSGAHWPDDKPEAQTPAASKGISPEQRAFWSIQPLSSPAVPRVKNEAWAKSDIDRFVQARQEQIGLQPVEAAERAILLRRASLDLIGLPPSPEEVAEFVADESAGAFAKVVERLLASPHYGETWGRWWLDVARYAEDDCRSQDPQGRGLNPYPNAYLYRDWVVQAFNDDMPFDQFVEAQLAADLLDESRRVALLPALGFLGLGPWLYDNGSVEVTRSDERHDRVDAVSRGFLGLTVACARCHDHKYDPVPIEDYYSMASVFLNTRYREYPQVPQALVDEYVKSDARIEAQEKLLGEISRQQSKQLSYALVFQSAKYMEAAWLVQGPARKNTRQVVDDKKLDYELFERWLKFLTDPPKNYHHLSDWQALIAKGGTPEAAQKLAERFQQELIDLLFERVDIDRENEIIRAKALPTTKPRGRAKLPNEFLTNDDFCPGCGLELKGLERERANLWTDVFEYDLDAAVDLAGNIEEAFKEGLLSFSGHGRDQRLGAEQRAYLQVVRDDLKAARKKLGEKFPYVHGVEDLPTPMAMQVNLRGSPFRLGAQVPARFPAFLSGEVRPEFAKGSGRLELAKAIVAHPISARVIVNRIWKGHFGTGIVETASDFGFSGERPTNPALLEYMAARFVANGGSFKQMHREILLSSVYQLSDRADSKNLDIDAGNRAYWRANPRRLSAEALRDSVLTASGSIDLKLGGPSETLSPTKKRRTLYARISRYRLDPYLALFDFPSPAATSERRFTTTVPQQRLFLMNSDFMQQQAETLARRVETEPDDKARIAKLYSLLFARSPSEAELHSGLTYLAAEPLQAYEERKIEAAKPKEGEPAMVSTADDSAEERDGNSADAGSMMDGIAGEGDEAKKPAKPLPDSVLGRYAKVLLSSHEFLYVR